MKHNLSGAVSTLLIETANTISSVADIDKGNISELLRAYVELDQELDRIEDAKKELKRCFLRLDTTLIPEALIAMDSTGIKAHGYNFNLTSKLYASIPEDKRDQGFTWLKEQGYGALIRETVHAASLSSVVKKYIEENGAEPPDNAISVHQVTSISKRKA